MIIKSHIRGGYRSAAQYLKDIGKNEKTRLVEISDPDAKNLDEAFHNMWSVASNTRATKPLHHISINPFKDERLTDEQVLKIVRRAEEKYGYKPSEHQRVIVEHIRDGRQHFHVIWNRVSLCSGHPIWPGEHWKKSKQACREMERELGLKTPVPRRLKRVSGASFERKRTSRKPVGAKTVGGHKPPKEIPITTTRAFVEKGKFQVTSFFMPKPEKKGWPDMARIDWEIWGHRNPPKFWAKWPELAPPGFQADADPRG